MKAFFSLMIAALHPFVRCTPSCECPAPEEILMKDNNFFRFRDPWPAQTPVPWPFLTSPERLYLKYGPFKLLENIKCIISELIENDPRSGYLERNVSWTNIGEPPTRQSIDVELERTNKSKSEVTEEVGAGKIFFWPFVLHSDALMNPGDVVSVFRKKVVDGVGAENRQRSQRNMGLMISIRCTPTLNV
uniref:Putative salivary lipocalin n=1 Tax=Ixodes ricinus TaxID=34613 RepID=A0A6B0V161_IXORI